MTSLIFLIAIPVILIAITPWQLFQQMCPLVSPNSPQCLRSQTQQQPLQQQEPFSNYTNTLPQQQQPLP